VLVVTFHLNGWSDVAIVNHIGLLGFGLHYVFRPRRRVTYLRDDNPLEVARMRLTRGEITSEEFEKIISRIRK
jgi:uncharacterized membrane protein